MEPVIFSIAVQLQKHIVGAISSVPRSSKCSKIVGGWGFAPDPTGGAYVPPYSGGSMGGAIAPPPLEWSLKSFFGNQFSQSSYQGLINSSHITNLSPQDCFSTLRRVKFD